MDVRWMSAFVDMAPERFDAGAEFWRRVTETTLSASHGEHGEFATLVPAAGDPYLRVQRTANGSSGIHLDLYVDAPRSAAARAENLGAQVQADEGSYLLMRSPGQYPFCFVSHDGEAAIPAAVQAPKPNRVDQVCIDIPPDVYDTECDFWTALTGWPMEQSRLSEFRWLHRPDGIALRLLLQRRDAVTPGDPTHAHLDIACGENIDDVAEHHVALGATQIGRTKVWMPMIDPAGLPYCLTPRGV